MAGKGISSPGPSLVWPDMVRFKHTFVDDVPASNDRSFAEAGIRAIQGRAHFVGPASLRVGDETLVGRHVVIAAGARHAPLAIPGEEHLTTSTEFMDLEKLPRRVAFVGGGYIAFEFAHVAARAGAEEWIARHERAFAASSEEPKAFVVSIQDAFELAARSLAPRLVAEGGA
jgi:glutathione reductase (NADPH)